MGWRDEEWKRKDDVSPNCALHLHSDFHHSNPSSSLLCQFPSIPLYLFIDHSNQSNLVLNPSYLMSIIALTHTILYHYTPYSSPLHSLQNEWFCSLFLLIVAGFRKVWKSLVLECSDDKFRSYHIYDDDKSLLTHSLIVEWIRRWRRGGVSLRRNDSIDSRSCMPWKVVWLPFGEVPGRKQILDWWAVELVQACSFPSTIFHIRMSCYAALILGKNHSRDNLIVCRISGCEDIDLPLQVSGVSLIVWSTWWATSSTRRS